MIVNTAKTVEFLSCFPSPIMSCCVDDGEFGKGYYIDLTNKTNTAAVNVLFTKSRLLAVVIYKGLERIGWHD